MPGVAANGGGKNVNQYTVAFDIRLPKLGVEYALLNSAPHGDAPGNVWISKNGKVGQGNYSNDTLAANVWYRVVFSTDLAKGERKYFFINGKLAHQQIGEKIDGRFSLQATGKPFFTLFADSKGEASPIDVQQIALWNYTMPDSAVSALGGPAVKIAHSRPTRHRRFRDRDHRDGGAGRIRPPAYFPDACRIGVSRAISLFTSAASACGPRRSFSGTSAPRSVKRLRNASSSSPALSACTNRSSTSCGVPFGANTP